MSVNFKELRNNKIEPGTDLVNCLLNHPDLFNWESVSRYIIVPDTVINTHPERLNMRILVRTQDLSSEVLEKHADLMDWDDVQAYQVLPVGILEKNRNTLNWEVILKSNKYPSEVLNYLATTGGDDSILLFQLMTIHQDLDSIFIQQHLDDLNMVDLIRYQELNEDFRREHWHILPKRTIC